MKNYFQKFPALGYRDFRLWWIGQFVNIAGNQMQLVAINWHIYILTHSAIALGMIGLARFIPIVVFSLFGGIVSDIYNRKTVNLFSTIVMTLVALVLTVTTYTGTISVMLLFLATVLTSISGAFAQPSGSALTANLVEKKDLGSAMSLITIMREAATIIGPGIAGFMIAYTGLGSVYLVNVLSFFAIIAAVLMVSTSGHVIGKPTVFSLKAIGEGIRFVVRHTILWSTMILDFLSTFFSSATVLLPIFAKDILHVGPQGVGLLYAAPSFGAVVGGLLLAHIKRIPHQGKLLLGGICLYGIGTILFGLSKLFFLSLLALSLVGFGDSISTVLRNTIRQAVTPDYIRGRMVSINMIFYMGGPQLGEFEGGLLASAVGTPLSVVIGGIGTLVILGIMAYTISTLRNYE